MKVKPQHSSFFESPFAPVIDAVPAGASHNSVASGNAAFVLIDTVVDALTSNVLHDNPRRARSHSLICRPVHHSIPRFFAFSTDRVMESATFAVITWAG